VPLRILLLVTEASLKITQNDISSS